MSTFKNDLPVKAIKKGKCAEYKPRGKKSLKRGSQVG